MNYKGLIEHLKECSTYGFKQEECRAAATAITELLSRAEAAEARAEKAEEILRILAKPYFLPAKKQRPR